MNVKRTVISHFYNEEFLLPFWLNHHKQFFDFGILINYASTDRSVEICKEICPNWSVVDSINPDFNVVRCDQEVAEYERHTPGWRTALNVTEFLVGDIERALPDTDQRIQYFVPAIAFYDWNPTGTILTEQPLWKQFNKGISYKDNLMVRRSRSVHNFAGVRYEPGRHFYQVNCEDLLIFHYANCISNPAMLNRRLQIQTRIPKEDVDRGWGLQHTDSGRGLSEQSLREMLERDQALVKDCSNYIEQYTRTF